MLWSSSLNATLYMNPLYYETAKMLLLFSSEDVGPTTNLIWSGKTMRIMEEMVQRLRSFIRRWSSRRSCANRSGGCGREMPTKCAGPESGSTEKEPPREGRTWWINWRTFQEDDSVRLGQAVILSDEKWTRTIPKKFALLEKGEHEFEETWNPM